jgi:beta-glucosidase
MYRYGTYSTAEALNAGLDLEMPGPPRWRTQTLVSHSMSAGKLAFETLNARVATLLSFVQRLAKSSPEVVFGDGVERTRDTPERREFCRELAAESIILLKNDGVLPLKPQADGKKLKVAVVGPNAQGTVISGGGSAALKATYVVTPFDGIAAAKDVEVSYAVGCYAHKFLPTIESLLTTPNGEPGWSCAFHAHKEGTEEPVAEPVGTFVLTDTRVKLNDFLPAGLGPTWSLELRGSMKPPTTGPYEFGIAVAGRARLYVNGKEVIDNWTKQRAGEFFYG